MKLKEFKKSSMWKAADCVEYVDKNGVEIEPTTEVQRRRMDNMEVISHGTTINGSIATLEVVLEKIKRMTTQEKLEEIETVQKAINTEDTKQTIIDNVINMIWDIAKISPEYGNALMDVLGDDVYDKIGKQVSKEEVII